MRKDLIAGNWKMHGSRVSTAQLLGEILAGIRQASTEIAVCPTYIHLGQALDLCAESAVSVGAQDCSHMSSGAYTGEVAAEMLRDIGCEWTLVGHSERRQYHAESEDLLEAKVAAAIAAGLRPVLCATTALATASISPVER